jgi:predicted DsbA family dithiol-disulfide isomerase
MRMKWIWTFAISFSLMGCEGEVASNSGGEKPSAEANSEATTASTPTVDDVLDDEGVPEIVASVGGKDILLAELDEMAKGQLDQLRAQAFEIRKSALQQLVDEMLLNAEAEKRSIPLEELFVEEIEEKAVAPTPNEVADFYMQNQDKMEASLEEMMPRLNSHLLSQRRHERMGAYLAEIRKAGNVEIFLKPRRIVVEPGDAARKGSAEAPIQIIEFSDFQCPYCTRGAKVIDEVVAHYGDKVSVVFKHFPLDFHKEAHLAAQAAECAREQGKFWEYHDMLFANQQNLAPSSLVEYALQLDLEAEPFEACLQEQRYAGRVNADLVQGGTAGMSGTPGFYINGILLSGAQPLENFKEIIDEELAQN